MMQMDDILTPKGKELFLRLKKECGLGLEIEKGLQPSCIKIQYKGGGLVAAVTLGDWIDDEDDNDDPEIEACP